MSNSIHVHLCCNDPDSGELAGVAKPDRITIEFTVLGEQKPQGSTRVVPIRQKGGGYKMRPDGRPMLRPIHDEGAKLKSWRSEIANAARAVYDGGLLTGAIRLSITFYRPRPANHFGSGKNADKLKADVPKSPITRPDVLKLARALEDSLSGLVYVDDSQIVDEHLFKRYGTRFETQVIIESLDGKTRSEI